MIGLSLLITKLRPGLPGVFLKIAELRFKEGDRASMVRKKAADGYNPMLSGKKLYVLGYENFSSKHLNFNSNV